MSASVRLTGRGVASSRRRDEILRDAHLRASRAFSAVSEIYDAETELNAVVAMVRAQTLACLSDRFRAGDSVIELGCGTGVEAVSLARLGINVVATDIAPGMVAATTERIARERQGDRVRVHLLAASAVDTLLGDYRPLSFAGAYSSFGPLNCDPDLGAVARGLARLVRPGGRVMISAINRYHAGEFAWYAMHGDFARATRRWSGYSIGTVSPTLPDRVPTFYRTPRAFTAAFIPWFRVLDCRALLLFLPPPYLAHLIVRYPRLARVAGQLDKVLAPVPLLRGLGDHFWLELERL